jgi:hypothetical protein
MLVVSGVVFQIPGRRFQPFEVEQAVVGVQWNAPHVVAVPDSG